METLAESPSSGSQSVADMLRKTPKGRLKYDKGPTDSVFEVSSHTSWGSQHSLDFMSHATSMIVKEVAQEIHNIKVETVREVALGFHAITLRSQQYAEEQVVPEQPEVTEEKEIPESKLSKSAQSGSKQKPRCSQPLLSPSLTPVTSPVDLELAKYERERISNLKRAKLERQINFIMERKRILSEYEQSSRMTRNKVVMEAEKEKQRALEQAEENLAKSRASAVYSPEKERQIQEEVQREFELLEAELNRSLARSKEVQKQLELQQRKKNCVDMIKNSLCEAQKLQTKVVEGPDGLLELPTVPVLAQKVKLLEETLKSVEANEISFEDDQLVVLVQDACEDVQSVRKKLFTEIEEWKPLPEQKPEEIPIPTKIEPQISEPASFEQKSESSREEVVFQNCLKLISGHEEKLKPLLASKDTNEFRLLLQKAVTTTVNAINAHTSAHLKDKYNKLKNILKGQAVKVGQNTAQSSAHPLGKDLVLQYLSEKFVSQGGDVISSKMEQAFSMATVITSLWIEFPEFGEMFIAHLFKACPTLIPVHCSRANNENESQYLKRMTGLIRLYCAICIANTATDVVRKNHPHGLGNMWTLLVVQLSIKPQNNITAMLLHEVLNICGNQLINKYGNMFLKLIEVIKSEYFEQIKLVTQEGCGGPISRLEGILNQILTNRCMNVPKDLVPPGFI